MSSFYTVGLLLNFRRPGWFSPVEYQSRKSVRVSADSLEEAEVAAAASVDEEYCYKVTVTDSVLNRWFEYHVTVTSLILDQSENEVGHHLTTEVVEAYDPDDAQTLAKAKHMHDFENAGYYGHLMLQVIRCVISDVRDLPEPQESPDS